MQINIEGESVSGMRDVSMRHNMQIQQMIEEQDPTYDAIVGGAFALTIPPDTHIMHLGSFESLERRLGSIY